MKLLKKLSFLIIMLLAVSVTASAMPDAVWQGDNGNNSDMIVITNPPKDKSATFDKSYVIAGSGREGTVVAIYKQSADGVYYKTDYVWQVGSSGYFFQKIDLTSGKNVILCRAEDGSGQYQITKLEINYLGDSFTKALDKMSVNYTTIPMF